jgi:hypothetical protein
MRRHGCAALGACSAPLRRSHHGSHDHHHDHDDDDRDDESA